MSGMGQKRARHLDIKHHFVQDLCREQPCNFKHWSINLNVRMKKFNLDVLQITGEEKLMHGRILLPLNEWTEWCNAILDVEYNAMSDCDERDELMEYISCVLKDADREEDEGIGSVRRKKAASIMLNNAAHAVGLDKIDGLSKLFFGHVHCGFGRAYERIRTRIHTEVQKILLDMIVRGIRPKLYVGGHSMGGALATHCAFDLEVHTLSKVNTVDWNKVFPYIAKGSHGVNNGKIMEAVSRKFCNSIPSPSQ